MQQDVENEDKQRKKQERREAEKRAHRQSLMGETGEPTAVAEKASKDKSPSKSKEAAEEDKFAFDLGSEYNGRETWHTGNLSPKCSCYS